MTDEVTSDGKECINRWKNAVDDIAKARSRLNSCDCELSNAATALARWMLPSDAQVGEKIAVWYGDSLVQVECTQAAPMKDGKITVRSRGKSGL
jgi:hypothetical protein